MLKYVSKFMLDILPSVIATVVGAYIVNHYIVPRPGADAAKSAAVSKVDPTQPPKATTANLTTSPDPAPARDAAPRDPKPKAADKAKGSPDKSLTDKTQADKAPLDKASEPAKTEPEPPRRLTIREKPADKVQPQAAPADTAAIGPAAAPDDHPNAAELARAALERLRVTEPARSPEATASIPAPVPVPQTHDASREPSRDTVLIDPRPAVPPLPPPVSVAAPPERVVGAPGAEPEGSRSWVRSTEAERIVPPADIPTSSAPVELQPAAVPPAHKKSVTEDVLSAARSVFQSVVPQ
jgi:hypothetical protein